MLNLTLIINPKFGRSRNENSVTTILGWMKRQKINVLRIVLHQFEYCYQNAEYYPNINLYSSLSIRKRMIHYHESHEHSVVTMEIKKKKKLTLD